MRGIQRHVVAATGLGLLSGSSHLLSAFIHSHSAQRSPSNRRRTFSGLVELHDHRPTTDNPIVTTSNAWTQSLQCLTLSLFLALSPVFAFDTGTSNSQLDRAPQDTTTYISNTISTTKTYDGFADYAKDNKMQQSDVGCFLQKCGEQTKALFSNPRGIKGVSWYVC